MNSQLLNVTQPVFYILLVLSLKDSHGYEIMKQVEAYSNGRIKLGPGTLYGAIKRMLREGLIEEIFKDEDIEDERRRYYRITNTGREALGGELDVMMQALNIANRNVSFSLK